MHLFARFRVALGWAVAPLVLIVAAPSGASLAVGLAIAAVGEALRIWASGHLNKAREVTASGPYRWFAHPLYVGSSIMGAGLAVASHSLVAAGMIALYLWTTVRAAIRSEEAFLRRAFGDEYDLYRRMLAVRTAAPGGRRFSVAQAVANREYRAVLGFVLAFALLFLKGRYASSF